MRWIRGCARINMKEKKGVLSVKHTVLNVKKIVFEVNNLSVEFATQGGRIHAVRDVSFKVASGETLAIVGESGSGKSACLQAAMGLLDKKVARVQGSVCFEDQELLHADAARLNKVRGPRIGMIFQDPMSALNPTMKVGDQIAEMLQVHEHLPKAEARLRATELLTQMGVPDAQRRARQYPFEFSGGMLQRVMIAQSLACKPQLLIADEPTTALDVTIQQQVLNLIRSYQKQHAMALILVTHDLAIIAQMADQVAVMYAGKIVEEGGVDEIFYQSAHPYTLGLKQALPANQASDSKQLIPIPGSPPDMFHLPAGCAFAPRCSHKMAICEKANPPVFCARESAAVDPHLRSVHAARCWLHHSMASPEQQKVVAPFL